MGYISQFEASDIDSDDIDLRFEVDAVETGTTVSIVDECGHAAQIITALLDELEKAQRANVAQDDHINQQQDRIEQLEKGHKKPLSKSIRRRLAKQNIAERGKDISELEAARQRIAELEARKVNLSKLSVGEVMHMSGFSRDYAEGGVLVMTMRYTKYAPLASRLRSRDDSLSWRPYYP